jgi:hypothetical protein
MSPFIESGYYYVYQILQGVGDALKKKESIEWGKLLDFIHDYINRDEFWEDKFKVNDDNWDATHLWVLGAVCEVISTGVRHDGQLFKEKHYNSAKNIVTLILNNIIGLTEDNRNNDYVSYVLNSSKGKGVEALLLLSLYNKRSYKGTGSKSAVWDNDLKTIFIQYLSEGVVDAYITFGRYLPQFLYLDKEWTMNQIANISFTNKSWEGFMVGYIYSGTIYKEIYIAMKGHYWNALNFAFSQKRIKGDLANHIGIGYLNCFEDEINFELYKELIKIWDYEMIEKLLWYFWTQEDIVNSIKEGQTEIESKKQEYIRARVLDFWDELYNKYTKIDASELNNEDKKVISDSLKLITILKQIDNKEYEKLKFAMPYVESNYNSHLIIEKLHDRISLNDRESTRILIGNLLLELVESCYATYPQELIIDMVQYLYYIKNEELKNIADKICNAYARKNVNFLQDIYIKNQDYN